MDIREALQTLRDNIRDEKGSVQRLGIRDNDYTREAISVLLNNEAALSANDGEAAVEIDIRRNPMDGTPEPRVLRFTDLGDGVHKLYARPTPPSVAVPIPAYGLHHVSRMYQVMRRHDSEIDDVAVDSMRDTLRQVLASQQPDHTEEQ